MQFFQNCQNVHILGINTNCGNILWQKLHTYATMRYKYVELLISTTLLSTEKSYKPVNDNPAEKGTIFGPSFVLNKVVTL